MSQATITQIEKELMTPAFCTSRLVDKMSRQFGIRLSREEWAQLENIVFDALQVQRDMGRREGGQP